MNPINLHQYIANWMILTNLAWRDLFDVIVYENFSNDIIELPKDIKLISLSNLGKWSWVAWKVATIQKTHKKVLVVLEHTPVTWLLSLLETPARKDESLIVISLGTGLSWIASFWKATTHDIWYIWATQTAIHDPHDVVQCFGLLEQQWKRYIRIQSWEYPPTLIESVPVINEWWLYNCIKHWLSWPNWTLLVWWRVSNELFYACSKLQEAWPMYDSFIVTDWNWAITDDLRNSLLNTEKLILVVDWNEKYAKQYAQSTLFNSGLYEVEVIIISPEVNGVTTTQIEYLYDQADFWVESFVQKLAID